MLFPFLVLFKFKGGGIIVFQNQSGIKLFAGPTGQTFEDGRPTCGYQISDIALCKKRSTDLTKYMKVAALVSAFGDFGINAHTFVTTFRAVVGGVRLLHLWSKGKEFLADSADV